MISTTCNLFLLLKKRKKYFCFFLGLARPVFWRNWPWPAREMHLTDVDTFMRLKERQVKRSPLFGSWYPSFQFRKTLSIVRLVCFAPDLLMMIMAVLHFLSRVARKCLCLWMAVRRRSQRAFVSCGPLLFKLGLSVCLVAFFLLLIYATYRLRSVVFVVHLVPTRSFQQMIMTSQLERWLDWNKTPTLFNAHFTESIIKASSSVLGKRAYLNFRWCGARQFDFHWSDRLESTSRVFPSLYLIYGG